MTNPVYPTGIRTVPLPSAAIYLTDPELGRIEAREQADGSYRLVPANGVSLHILKQGSLWIYDGQTYGHPKAALWAALNQWKGQQQ